MDSSYPVDQHLSETYTIDLHEGGEDGDDLGILANDQDSSKGKCEFFELPVNTSNDKDYEELDQIVARYKSLEMDAVGKHIKYPVRSEVLLHPDKKRITSQEVDLSRG